MLSRLFSGSKYLLVIFLILNFSLVSGQENTTPYIFKYKADIPVVLSSLILELEGFNLTQQIVPFTEAEIADLNSMTISGFDRPVTTFFNPGIGDVSDWFLYTAPLYPVLLVASDKKMRGDYLILGAMTLETIFMAESLVRFTKGAFKRTRPLVYNDEVPYDTFKDGKGAKVSFFSGHTALVSSMSFFTARIFADYHPDSNWRYVVWGVAASVPAVVAGMRVSAGKHFYSDVIAGYLLGGAIGYFIPVIHKKRAGKKNENLDIDVGMNMARLSYQF